MNTLIRLKARTTRSRGRRFPGIWIGMVAAGEKIFAALREDLSRASQVRKFMNYYLPTTDKLIAQYRNLRSSGSRGETVTGAMRSIEKSLGMIADAFEKQLDSLYKHEALDIQTDIDVLETMLSADRLNASQEEKAMSEIKLTLHPNQPEASGDTVAVSQPVPEPAVREPQFSPEEARQIEAFAKQIDITDSTLVVSYGAAAQEKYRAVFRQRAEKRQNRDLDEVGI